MSFEHRPSPARVTEAAAAKLPRWILLVLLVAYVLPGLFGRDPWSLEDASAFGVMWTMAQGHVADWLLPGVVGQPLPEEGPLPFWMGALMIRLFGGLFGAIDAARLVSVLWFALATWSLWYAVYRLARRAEAQPVALAFGGEASPRDYGRMLADIAVLLTLATFGIAVRLHETVAETALFAWVSALLLSLAVALEDEWKGTVAAGLVLAAIALSRGWLVATLMTIASVVFLSCHGTRRTARVATVLALAFGGYALWPLAARMLVPGSADYLAALRQWNLDQFGPSLEGAGWLLRNAGWYTWPLWPFALWTLYSWRSFLRRPLVLLPLLVGAAGLLNLLLSSSPSDRELIGAVPALVILAAFSVSTLRRAADNAIDWFSIALFFLVLLGAWLYFVAWNVGVPPKMAASVARIVPGLAPAIHPVAMLTAFAATVAWLVLALWRARVRPPMLWRGPVLAAAGLTVTWVLVVDLYGDAVEYNRGMKGTATILGEQVRRLGGPDACVQAHQLPIGMRAMLAYHGGIRFSGSADDQGDQCSIVVHRDSQRTNLDDAPPIGDWQLAYETRRRARVDEVFKIWVRRR